MKIFVYEFVTASNERPGRDLPRAASLLAEGRAMRDAATADAGAIPGAIVRSFAATHEDEETEFCRLSDWCDYALIIAPEFDGILGTRCRWAVECGATLLGPSPTAVALCADKLALAETWSNAGVPTPATKPFDSAAFAPPVVVKPRFGAGAIDTFVFDQRPLDYQPATESIIQPFVAGQPASVSLLIGPNQTIALTPSTQKTQRERRSLSPPSMLAISYQGGIVPLDAPGAADLAKRAAAAVPGLFGYIGVDLILGERDVAIEINPRLTTSYIGLRQIYACNLVQMLIDIVNGRPAMPLPRQSKEIEFFCDGTVQDASTKRR